MAPTAPRQKVTAHRAKALARIADPTLPRKVHRAGASVSDSFINSKRDKRIIRHSSFVSKIEKARPAAKAKKRRPSKKLVTTLESLADALPELDEVSQELQQGRVRHKSLRSKPGALRRKEKIMKGEMARFGESLARLSAIRDGPVMENGEGAMVMEENARKPKDDDTPAQSTSAANRWAALRSFISATMEQNPAFLGKT